MKNVPSLNFSNLPGQSIHRFGTGKVSLSTGSHFLNERPSVDQGLHKLFRDKRLYSLSANISEISNLSGVSNVRVVRLFLLKGGKKKGLNCYSSCAAPYLLHPTRDRNLFSSGADVEGRIGVKKPVRSKNSRSRAS